MNRFTNPHLQYNANMRHQGGGIGGNQQNMQPNQQNMQPNQPNVSMQQVMGPNGPMMVPMQQVMTPNGPMMVPVQQPMGQGYPGSMQGGMNMPNMPNTGMMGQQFGMQQYSGMGQSNINRFGASDQGVNSSLSVTTQERGDMSDSRYGYSQQEVTGMGEEQDNIPDSYTIEIRREIRFENNDKVVLTTYMEPVTSRSLDYGENICIVDCFDAGVEYIAEQGNIKDNKKILTAREVIVNNLVYKTVDQGRFNEVVIGDNNIKSLYKVFKTAFATLTDKYGINLFNVFDTILTEYINNYVGANTGFNISIDSFMSDFNDLLKVIRDNEEDLEDALIEHMDEVLDTIRKNIDIVAKTEDFDKSVVSIPESYVMCHVDKFSYELGVNNCPDRFVLVEDNAPNRFLVSLANLISKKFNCVGFHMVTADKMAFSFMLSREGDIFIKRQ